MLYVSANIHGKVNVSGFIIMVMILLLNWLLFLLRIEFFCVALNYGRHPYLMGSFCKVFLFDWLRVGLLNLGLIKLLFSSTLILGLVLSLELYQATVVWYQTPRSDKASHFVFKSVCVIILCVKNPVLYQESPAL